MYVYIHRFLPQCKNSFNIFSRNLLTQVTGMSNSGSSLTDSRESFTWTLLDFYLSFTPFVLLLALFLSLFLLYWLFFLCTLVLFSSVAHGLFYASCREWREAANNSNFKSFQPSNPVGKGEVFLASILKHNERIPVSIVLALCQIFHGLRLDAHLSRKGQSVWLTTSRELHEFKEEHFSNGGGGVLSSVEGQKWFKTDKKLSHVFSYEIEVNIPCWDVIPPFLISGILAFAHWLSVPHLHWY